MLTRTTIVGNFGATKRARDKTSLNGWSSYKQKAHLQITTEAEYRTDLIGGNTSNKSEPLIFENI